MQDAPRPLCSLLDPLAARERVVIGSPEAGFGITTQVGMSLHDTCPHMVWPSFPEDGEMAKLVRSHYWAATPLGPIEPSRRASGQPLT